MADTPRMVRMEGFPLKALKSALSAIAERTYLVSDICLIMLILLFHRPSLHPASRGCARDRRAPLERQRDASTSRSRSHRGFLMVTCTFRICALDKIKRQNAFIRHSTFVICHSKGSTFVICHSPFICYSAIKMASGYPSSIKISSCRTASFKVENFPTRTR